MGTRVIFSTSGQQTTIAFLCKPPKWRVSVVFVVSRRTTKFPLKEFVSSGKIYLPTILLLKFLLFVSPRFPCSEHPLHDNWVQIIQNQMNNPLFVPDKNSIVCSNHFEEDCFNRSQRRLSLREGSKPTIFSNVCDSAEQVLKRKSKPN